MKELTDRNNFDKYNWDELFNGSVWEIHQEDCPEHKYLIEGWFSYAREIAKRRYQMKLTYRTQERNGAGDPTIIWMKAIKN